MINGGCSGNLCGPKPPAPAKERPAPGAMSSAGRPVPMPYGSRGELSRIGAGANAPPPPAGVKPHSAEKGLGSREFAPMRVPAAPPAQFEPYPTATRAALAKQPEIGKSTRPLHLIHDPALYWARTYPVRPTVGDWKPMDGQPRRIGTSIEGGRPLPRTWVTYPSADKLLPMDVHARKRMRAFNLEVRRLRLLAKTRVTYTAGISGYDAANAFRGKPGTPGGFQGSGRQELARPTTVRGRLFQQDIAPTPTLERMADEARTYGAKI